MFTKRVIILIGIIICFVGLDIECQEVADVVVSDSTNVVATVEVPDTILPARDTSGVVDFHPQDSPEEAGFLIITQDGKSQLRLRGSIRMNGAVDLNGLQSKENFQTFDIPVGDANISETRFFLSAKQTRFGLEASKKTSRNTIRMRIEGDFYGTSNTLRLRHGYGSYRYYLVGQTWSVFGDPYAIPWTVDFEGPNSAVLERTVQIRFSRKLGDDFRFTSSLEAPSVDIEAPDSVERAYQSIPDIIVRMRRNSVFGHIQVAGLVRNINVKTARGNKENLIGYGLLLTSRINLGDNKHLLYQFVGGKGIARYITSLTGRNMDVVYEPSLDNYELLGIFGGYISLGINWSEKVFSYFTPGFTSVVNEPFQPNDAFKYSGYFSGNVFLDIIEGLRAGAEYSWGSRVNKDGDFGMANRVSFIVYYDF